MLSSLGVHFVCVRHTEDVPCHDLVVVVTALRMLSPLVVAHAFLVVSCILAVVWVSAVLLQPSLPMLEVLQSMRCYDMPAMVC